MGATKIFVSSSQSSWCTSFLMKTRFKESYCKWLKAIICDRKKCLYFLGLYKSLRVVSKFMHLEWCRRETNQIPRRSARTDEEFGLIFDFVKKWTFSKSWKSTKVVGKFVDTKWIFRKKWVKPKSLSHRADRHSVLKRSNCKWS